MKKLCICVVLLMATGFISGCGLIFPAKNYDGSEAYSEAHPDQVQRPSYMNPDNDYQNTSPN